MKKIFTLFVSTIISSVLYAQVSDGFYRVKNAETERYLYVHDDKGKAENIGAQLIVDINAIYLRADLENAISNPGSIVYVERHGSGNQYNFAAQGTSVYSILSNYVTITSRSGYYSVGAEKGGISAYLADGLTKNKVGYGVITTDSKGARLWDPIPVKSDSENYFGLQPSIKSGDKYYGSFFASFGYKAVSSDTKLYYVSKICESAVLLSEITDKVPNETPIIVEGVSNVPSDNKLDLFSVKTSLPSKNYLGGVYFDTDNSDDAYAAKKHVNRTPTQDYHRVLSVNADGKLVYVKPSAKYHSANTSYLDLKDFPDMHDELAVCFTLEEFNSYDPSSIDSVNTDDSDADVFDLLGKRIEKKGVLPAGIYIIGGKKTVIR